MKVLIAGKKWLITWLCRGTATDHAWGKCFYHKQRIDLNPIIRPDPVLTVNIVVHEVSHAVLEALEGVEDDEYHENLCENLAASITEALDKLGLIAKDD